MRVATTESAAAWILSTISATAVFWTTFGACVDAPDPSPPPQALVIAVWDPLACGDPHRVVVELADAAGASQSLSTPCEVGSLTIELAHLGSYSGRIYGWTLGAPPSEAAPVALDIEQPIVRWEVTPPP